MGGNTINILKNHIKIRKNFCYTCDKQVGNILVLYKVSKNQLLKD